METWKEPAVDLWASNKLVGKPTLTTFDRLPKTTDRKKKVNNRCEGKKELEHPSLSFPQLFECIVVLQESSF
jgi:hypothetical protein